MAKNNLSISPCCVPCRLSAFELDNLSFPSNGNSWKVLYAEACLQPMWRLNASEPWKRSTNAKQDVRRGLRGRQPVMRSRLTTSLKRWHPILLPNVSWAYRPLFSQNLSVFCNKTNMFAKTRFREIQQVPISTIVLLKGRRISFVVRKTSSYILLYIALYIFD